MIEIERKFLLKFVPPRTRAAGWIESYIITQSYDGDTRYRSEGARKDAPAQYIRMTKKSVKGQLGASEEGPIEVITADEYFKCTKGLRGLTKVRHIFSTEDPEQKIEVDEVAGLVIMEIEVPDITYPLSIPEDIRNIIIMEVTGDKRFSNRSLSKPFKLKYL